MGEVNSIIFRKFDRLWVTDACLGVILQGKDDGLARARTKLLYRSNQISRLQLSGQI